MVHIDPIGSGYVLAIHSFQDGGGNDPYYYPYTNHVQSMKVLTLYDKSGPKYHRCLLPLYLMDGIQLTVNHTLEESELNVDVVFINRVIPRTTLNDICDLRAKYGFKLIVDFDDHWRLDYDHYQRSTIIRTPMQICLPCLRCFASEAGTP